MKNNDPLYYVPKKANEVFFGLNFEWLMNDVWERMTYTVRINNAEFEKAWNAGCIRIKKLEPLKDFAQFELIMFPGLVSSLGLKFQTDNLIVYYREKDYLLHIITAANGKQVPLYRGVCRNIDEFIRITEQIL